MGYPDLFLTSSFPPLLLVTVISAACAGGNYYWQIQMYADITDIIIPGKEKGCGRQLGHTQTAEVIPLH